MPSLKTALALSAGALAAIACGGSTTNHGDGTIAKDAAATYAPEDASPDNDVSLRDASDAAICNPTAADNQCGEGTTCCFDTASALAGGIAALTSGLRGTCAEASACKTSVQVKCLTAAGCAAGQVCCVSGTLASGAGAASQLGAGGIAGLASLSAITTCETTCPAGETQACTATSDCIGLSAGLVCSPASLGPLNGAAGGLGGLVAGLLGGLATEKICSTPEAGAPTPEAGAPTPEAGAPTPEAGAPDSASPDSGTAADAADSGGQDAPVDGM